MSVLACMCAAIFGLTFHFQLLLNLDSSLFSSAHVKPCREEELHQFFASEVNKCEEANPSRHGKIRLTTSLSSIYENKYLPYCEETGIIPLRKNKFYEARKKYCKDIERSKEYKKSMSKFYFKVKTNVDIWNCYRWMEFLGL